MQMVMKKLDDLTEGQINWVVGSLERRQIVPAYTQNQEVTGAIIDRELISTDFVGGGYWIARVYHTHQTGHPSRLIAALKTYIHVRLGDTIHVPADI